MRKPDPRQRKRTINLNVRKLVDGRRNAFSLKKIRENRLKLQGKPKKFRVAAPEIFCLNGDNNRDELLLFFSEIKNALSHKNSKIHIDFKRTKKLLPCGTLYFRAHLNLLLDDYSHRITCGYPSDDVVGQLFQHINLLDKMGLSNKYVITADNVKHWHSVEGVKAETMKFENLLHSYEDELAQPMKLGLYESMSEAVTNCVQHAYETLNTEDSNQKWWMFANREENVLTVAIYDAGIGIAESLRIKPELRDIISGLAFRNSKSDKKLLSLAVGSNKTRTRLPYRGKGLPDMMQFVKSTNVGGLLIHSNCGSYMYAAHSNREQTKHYAQALSGTLIQWTLPLIDEVNDE